MVQNIKYSQNNIIYIILSIVIIIILLYILYMLSKKNKKYESFDNSPEKKCPDGTDPPCEL